MDGQEHNAPGAVPYFLGDHWVVEEGEVLEFCERRERLEGWEVGDTVMREVEGD